MAIYIAICGAHVGDKKDSFAGYCSELINWPKGQDERRFSSVTSRGALSGEKRTANRAELYAACQAAAAGFNLLANEQVKKIVIFTSSHYLIKGIGENNVEEGYIAKWIENDWDKANGDYVENMDLWQDLYDEVGYGGFEFKYIKDDDPLRKSARSKAHAEAEEARCRAKRELLS